MENLPSRVFYSPSEDKLYFGEVGDYKEMSNTAENTSFNGTISALDSDNVQDAIDGVVTMISEAGERLVIPNNVTIPAGEFEVELLDVCPGFDLADFSSWDITIKTIAPGKVTMTSIRDISDLSELQINKFDSGSLCFFLYGHSKSGMTIPAVSIISLNK